VAACASDQRTRACGWLDVSPDRVSGTSRRRCSFRFALRSTEDGRATRSWSDGQRIAPFRPRADGSRRPKAATGFSRRPEHATDYLYGDMDRLCREKTRPGSISVSPTQLQKIYFRIAYARKRRGALGVAAGWGLFLRLRRCEAHGEGSMSRSRIVAEQGRNDPAAARSTKQLKKRNVISAMCIDFLFVILSEEESRVEHLRFRSRGFFVRSDEKAGVLVVAFLLVHTATGYLSSHLTSPIERPRHRRRSRHRQAHRRDSRSRGVTVICVSQSADSSVVAARSRRAAGERHARRRRGRAAVARRGELLRKFPVIDILVTTPNHARRCCCPIGTR